MAAAPEDKTVVVSVRVGPYSKTTKQIDSEQYTTQVMPFSLFIIEQYNIPCLSFPFDKLARIVTEINKK
jgi:hypothetical protein